MPKGEGLDFVTGLLGIVLDGDRHYSTAELQVSTSYQQTGRQWRM